MKHIVDGAFRQPDGGGHGGADDIFAGVGGAAVSLTGKSREPAMDPIKPDGRHQTEIFSICTAV